MPKNPGTMLVIVTEGRDDVRILGALLERIGCQRTNEENVWIRGESQVMISPSKDEPGGKGNIPTLISAHWRFADRFLVVFDPDDQDPYREIERLCNQLKERLLQRDVQIQNRKYYLRDRRLCIIREVNGREVLLIFWPAMAVADQLSELIPTSRRAHSMLDYVLQMGLQEPLVQRLLGSRDFHPVRKQERIPADQFIPKLKEILNLLQRQGIEVCSSKRAMDFYVALLGFHGGFGRLGAEMVRNLDSQDVERVFGGLPGLLQNLLHEQQTAG